MKLKTKTKTKDALLKRPMKVGLVYSEVMGNQRIHNCLLCSRQFRALSKFNRVCEVCKQTDKWKDY